MFIYLCYFLEVIVPARSINQPWITPQALKEEGKTDEDIYAELKTLYNTTVGAGTAPPVANGPVAAGDVEKPAAAPDATAEATPSAETATTAAGETTAEPAAAAAAPEGGGGDVAAAAVAAPAEGAAPVEVPATAE